MHDPFEELSDELWPLAQAALLDYLGAVSDLTNDPSDPRRRADLEQLRQHYLRLKEASSWAAKPEV